MDGGPIWGQRRTSALLTSSVPTDRIFQWMKMKTAMYLAITIENYSKTNSTKNTWTIMQRMEFAWEFLLRTRARTHTHTHLKLNRESPRHSKPKRKGQTRGSWISPHFCEFWCFFPLGKQAQFTLNFCSGMPLWKVHELTLLWFGLSGPLLTQESILKMALNSDQKKHMVLHTKWITSNLGLGEIMHWNVERRWQSRLPLNEIGNYVRNCPRTRQKTCATQIIPLLWSQKINAHFFCTKFFENPLGHGRSRQNRGRPHQKWVFPAALVMGRNFLTPGHPSVRVGNVRREKFGPPKLCFCFPERYLVTLTELTQPRKPWFSVKCYRRKGKTHLQTPILTI